MPDAVIYAYDRQLVKQTQRAAHQRSNAQWSRHAWSLSVAQEIDICVQRHLRFVKSEAKLIEDLPSVVLSSLFGHKAGAWRRDKSRPRVSVDVSSLIDDSD